MQEKFTLIRCGGGGGELVNVSDTEKQGMCVGHTDQGLAESKDTAAQGQE